MPSSEVSPFWGWVIYDARRRQQRQAEQQEQEQQQAGHVVPGSLGVVPARTQPPQQPAIELVIPDSQATIELVIPDSQATQSQQVIPESQASTHP